MNNLIGNTNRNNGRDPIEKIDKGPTVFNKVERTPSGHQNEIEDTVGSERIKRSHCKGTYEEWNSDAGRDLVVVGHNYTAYHSGNELVVKGECQITVMGDCNLQVGMKEDSETGEMVGGSFNVEAQNINLNARESMCISAGANLELNTRQAEGGTSTGASPGGDIAITSAGGYNLTAHGEATAVFKKSLDTKITNKNNLSIGGNFETKVDSIATQYAELGTNIVSGENASINLASGIGGVGLSSAGGVGISSTEAAVAISSPTAAITFDSAKATVFNSEEFKIDSGPVSITETLKTESTITGGNNVELTTHIHTGDSSGDTGPPRA